MKSDSSVSALASGARGPRLDPRSRRGRFWCPNTLSLVSFAGMTLDKCTVFRIGKLTGCPLCREKHHLCRLKNPTVIYIWLLVGFHPETWSVQSTPADNAREGVRQYIGKESNVSNASDCRYVTDCRSRGRMFDPGPVPYFSGD